MTLHNDYVSIILYLLCNLLHLYISVKTCIRAFVGELMSYLYYLYLVTSSGIHHVGNMEHCLIRIRNCLSFAIVCVFFCVSPFCVSCVQCFLCLWNVHLWLPVRFSLKFIWINIPYNLIFTSKFNDSSILITIIS